MSEEVSKTMDTNPEIAEGVKNTEEYAYLDRGGFSSEKFKIEVRGLPKFYGIAELKKLMNQKLGLNMSKIKRPCNGSKWLFACFQNEEDRNRAITALNGYSWKGKTLHAEAAKPAPDPLVRKRKQEEKEGENKKKVKEDDGRSQEQKIKDATTPYWNIDYEEQLQLKEKEIRRLLMNFDNELWKIYKQKRGDIEANRKLYNGLSFELKPIQRSPVTEGYRNKCECTVGIDEETGKPTVGFRLGSYATGTVAVAPVHSQIHISDETKKAVLIFQDFVRKSEMAPFSPADYSGYWRYLTVRHSKFSGDIMLIISMHPQTLTEDELNTLKKQLIQHFSSDESVACGIKSVYFELLTQRRSGEDGSRAVHLMGSTHIIDSILGLQFRISPEAFFQVNTEGSNILYQSAIDLSQVKPDSTVLDICCGTGTIGLCFAKHCSKVLGLELVPEAVSDARENAKLNGISNAEFYAGRAEDALPGVLARAPAGDLLAIVDPPRAGLHMRAVTQLRNTEKVRRLVYLSCSPAAAAKNLLDLARPTSKTLRGAPFAPVAAVPVDMFPHTKHVELVVLFQREENSAAAEVESADKAVTSEETTKSDVEIENKEEQPSDTQSAEDNNVDSTENHT
ncbi:tRNA (uracil-5-)-methyltransferase homolog A [Epargyreus clarus]|uniref:tRNA (uracil-5-)-methyltransferase homolog A n=1 Tax=Epargyreus clarus TaxID=520877 RepID=UPI003C305CEA